MVKETIVKVADIIVKNSETSEAGWPSPYTYLSAMRGRLGTILGTLDLGIPSGRFGRKYQGA